MTLLFHNSNPAELLHMYTVVYTSASNMHSHRLPYMLLHVLNAHFWIAGRMGKAS